jgi:hypothetical protein
MNCLPIQQAAHKWTTSLRPGAKRFYEKWGFIPSPVEPMTLMITVVDAQKALAGN